MSPSTSGSPAQPNYSPNTSSVDGYDPTNRSGGSGTPNTSALNVAQTNSNTPGYGLNQAPAPKQYNQFAFGLNQAPAPKQYNQFAFGSENNPYMQSVLGANWSENSTGNTYSPWTSKNNNASAGTTPPSQIQQPQVQQPQVQQPQVQQSQYTPGQYNQYANNLASTANAAANYKPAPPVAPAPAPTPTAVAAAPKALDPAAMLLSYQRAAAKGYLHPGSNYQFNGNWYNWQDQLIDPNSAAIQRATTVNRV